jgi:hypothetical protein
VTLRTRLKHVEQRAGTRLRIMHVLSLPSHASETTSELISEAFVNSGIVRGARDVVLCNGHSPSATAVHRQQHSASRLRARMTNIGKRLEKAEQALVLISAPRFPS